MDQKAFLQVGLSFADIALYRGSDKVASRRFYLPQEPLGNSLKKFWQEFGEPQSLLISSRFMERIFDAKLGGTVAQIVTAGFETWPLLRQPVLPEHLTLKPFRREPLASQELIFGLSERVDHTGKILSPVNPTELEFILSKLKLMSVKRVCINLLFANANSTNQDQVAAYFKEQGFEVFAAPREKDSRDEMPSWKKNVFNACLAGAFNEHREEILKSFENKEADLKFLSSEGKLFWQDDQALTSSLFAWAHCLGLDAEANSDTLYLGYETWALISGKAKSAHWKSPWGWIAAETPKIKNLELQPTLEIINHPRLGMHISKNELGFEPGPMCFGRAQKPMLFDLLAESYDFQIPQIQASGKKRFIDQMTAMVRNSPRFAQLNLRQSLELILSNVISSLALEIQFAPTTNQIRLTGPLAEHFFKPLCEKMSTKTLSLDPTFSECELKALRAWSQR